MTNVSVFLAEAAEVYSDAVALRCGVESATYSELANDAARLADSLIDGGVRPGDRVAIMLPNGPAFVVVLYGVWYAGGVAVPMSPSQSARAVEYVLTISGSRVLLFTSRRAIATAAAAVTAGTQPIEVGKHGISHLIAGFRGRAEPVSRAADDTAVILHTTATSLVPRGAEFHPRRPRQQPDGHRAQAAQPRSCRPRDGVPAALGWIWDDLRAAGHHVRSCDAGAAAQVQCPHGAENDCGPARHRLRRRTRHVPRDVGRCDRYELDFGSLRVCMSAGAPLPVDVLRRFEDRFGCIVLEGYEPWTYRGVLQLWRSHRRCPERRIRPLTADTEGLRPRGMSR